MGVVLAWAYALLGAYLFCFSGLFADFGGHPWYGLALLVVTITSTLTLAYVSLLITVYLRRVRARPGDAAELTWHLLIPARDETSVIADTLARARGSFPRVHVWVIDDASEDDTAAQVRRRMVVDPFTHLISRVLPEARTGKGNALNAAYSEVSRFVRAAGQDPHRTIIGVLDADGYLSGNALDLLAGPDGFGDDTIGAVQLEVWMKNRGDKRPRPGDGKWKNHIGRMLVRMQDMEFRTANSAMQLLRSETETVGMGGNGQFTRLSILALIAAEAGAPWGSKLCEDYELGLQILAHGSRTAYIRDAHVSQEALPYLRRLLTQRTRWSQGNLECLADLRALLRRRRLSLPGFVEISYFMSQPILLMVNLIFIPIVLWQAVVAGTLGFGALQFGPHGDDRIALAGVGALVFLLLPYVAWGPLYRRWGGEDVGILKSWGLGLSYLLYVYLGYLYHPRAIARHMSGRTSWAKTKRNAEAHPVVPPHTPTVLAGIPLLDAGAAAGRDIPDARGTGAGGIAAGARDFALSFPARLETIRTAVAAEDTEVAHTCLESVLQAAGELRAQRLWHAAADLDNLVVGGDFAAALQAVGLLERVGTDTVDVLIQPGPPHTR